MDRAFVESTIREFEREKNGVELPLFRTQFENWLIAQGGISEASRTNYMRWLANADDWNLDPDWDFWSVLKKAWNSSDFQMAELLCNVYEDDLLEEQGQAENDEDYGVSSRTVGNWICAFRKYRKFFEEQMKAAPADKRALATSIEASRITADTLFLESRFISWGQQEGMSVKTLTSYVNGIKDVNNLLFCKTGFDLLFDFLPDYVETKNVEKIDEMFSAMDSKLTERIQWANDTEMPINDLQKGRTALRKYAEFIKSVI